MFLDTMRYTKEIQHINPLIKTAAMNLKSILSILVGLTVIFILSNCKKGSSINVGDTEPPVIKLMIDTLKPNLNIADNIPLVCVVFADFGLKSVKLELIKTTGTELYKEYVSFKDPTQFSVKELPLWEEDFLSFKITATDKADRVTVKNLPLSIVPYLAPAQIQFELSEIAIDENVFPLVIPTTKFTVKGAGNLTKIEVKLYSKTGITDIPLPVPIESDSKEYSFENFITYKDGDQALQVSVTDEYKKVKIETLPIKYVQLPSPVISFVSDSTFSSNVNGSINLKLNIKSVAGLVSVKIIKLKQAIEGESLPLIAYNEEHEVDFSQDITLENNVSALRIVVTDRLGRTSTVETPCTVGFEIRTFTLGSDFYNRGIVEEPDIYPFYSIGLNRSMTIGEAYPRFKDIEMYVLWFAAANGYVGDRGLRLMGPKNTTSLASSEVYYTGGTYTWQDKTYTTPSMFPASNWTNRNQTTFIKIGITSNSATIAPFNYDNVTIDDLKNYKTAITGDRMPFLVEGDICLMKLDAGASDVGFVGATTGVASKLCVLKVAKIENETRPLSFFTNPWITEPNIRKIAKVTFNLKIPK